jgi:hypothetical protein
MTVALLYIRVFLNVFREALALTTVTTYHPTILPQTLLFFYKECFEERNASSKSECCI